MADKHSWSLDPIVVASGLTRVRLSGRLGERATVSLRGTENRGQPDPEGGEEPGRSQSRVSMEARFSQTKTVLFLFPSARHGGRGRNRGVPRTDGRAVERLKQPAFSLLFCILFCMYVCTFVSNHLDQN